MSHEDDFQQLLEQARAGEGTALGFLFRDLHPRILRYLQTLEPSEAEDLASDTWLDVSAGLGRFGGDERALRAWAFTIARRRLVDLRRRRMRRPTVATEAERLEEIGPTGDVEDEAMTELATGSALKRIARLSPEQAEVVLLRVLGGLSVEDVARLIDKRPVTVRVIQHRALRRLARQLSQERVTR